jgi:hypothetical protein
VRNFVFLFLLVTVFAVSAQAEYRAFLLRIAKKASPQDYRLVKSTLDPLQYRTYNAVSDDEIVTYDDTWKCEGRTGDFKALCPSPRAPASDESSPSDGPENTP